MLDPKKPQGRLFTDVSNNGSQVSKRMRETKQDRNHAQLKLKPWSWESDAEAGKNA